MITIVESGGANIASIVFALERLGYKAEITHDKSLIQKASHVILPGVGSASTAMQVLKTYELDTVLCALTQPVLGICLGMQLLFDFSEEGNVDCLKLIPGKIQKFSQDMGLSVPHMGWNTIKINQESPLLKNIPENAYMYYVHSYRAPLGSATTAITQYGEDFTACVQNNNFFGVQFHPERSSEPGAQILKNFLELS